MAKKTTKSKTEYTVKYSDMNGVDLTGDGSSIESSCFSYTENMYRNYSGGGLESIPGYRRIADYGIGINGIHRQYIGSGMEYIIVHSGTRLFRFDKNIPEFAKDGTLIFDGMADVKSVSYSKGGSLFILDGTAITRVSPDGTVLKMEGKDAYVPTTFINGKPFEQRNLASPYFRETYEFGDAERLYRRSDNLVFEVDEDGKNCTLTSTKAEVMGEIYVPAFARIGESTYRVAAIGDYAFAGRKNVSSIHIANGVKSIGRYAFKGCTLLDFVECSPSTEIISEGAFSGCTELFSIYLGKHLSLIGNNCFDQIDMKTTSVIFGLDKQTASYISGIDQIEGAAVTYLAENPKECFAIPIMTPLESIESVMIDETELKDFSVSNKLKGDVPRHLYFMGKRSAAEGATVIINGTSAAGEYTDYGVCDDFISRSGTDASVIAECRTCASFDGRIFLSGNPKYPNTVFYSSEAKNGAPDDLFFGTLSYFDDGVGTYPTIAMVPVKDALAIFKAGDDGGGGIFCHERRSEDSVREVTYPVLNVHTGFGRCAAAFPFLDKAAFLSEAGVFMLERGTLGAAEVSPVSGKINPRILSLFGKDGAEFTGWQGYLVLRMGAELFLADFNHSKKDPAWYTVTEVGSWTNDAAVFKHASVEYRGFEFTDDDDSRYTSNEVYSTVDVYGEALYYLTQDNAVYRVFPTGERTGGVFCPMQAMFSDGELLFFGTNSGELMLFNTDKRGIAPDHIASAPGFDRAEFASAYKGRLHPEFYSFAGHAPRYTLVTKSDNCGEPNLSKCTVKDSLTLKLGEGSSRIKVQIRTDSGNADEEVLECMGIDFSDIDFSAFTFETRESFTVGARDRTRGWCEKQISISSDEYASPMFLQSIGYRYRLLGKIKRH